MRVRIALAAAAASLSLGLVAVPAAEAANGTTVPTKASSIPALDTVKLTGVAKNGKKFSGNYAIQRFAVQGGKAVAIGTVTGKLGGRHVTRYGVAIPASLTGQNSGTGQTGAARTAQASCPVLHLMLGPLKLNLLGLVVTLGGGTQGNLPIVLDITAVQGPGNLLGNLLCGLTNALNTGGNLSTLTGDVQQLATTLQSLLGLFGGIASGL